jgi:hypothetical protein
VTPRRVNLDNEASGHSNYVRAAWTLYTARSRLAPAVVQAPDRSLTLLSIPIENVVQKLWLCPQPQPFRLVQAHSRQLICDILRDPLRMIALELRNPFVHQPITSELKSAFVPLAKDTVPTFRVDIKNRYDKIVWPFSQNKPLETALCVGQYKIKSLPVFRRLKWQQRERSGF